MKYIIKVVKVFVYMLLGILSLNIPLEILLFHFEPDSINLEMFLHNIVTNFFYMFIPIGFILLSLELLIIEWKIIHKILLNKYLLMSVIIFMTIIIFLSIEYSKTYWEAINFYDKYTIQYMEFYPVLYLYLKKFKKM